MDSSSVNVRNNNTMNFRKNLAHCIACNSKGEPLSLCPETEPSRSFQKVSFPRYCYKTQLLSGGSPLFISLSVVQEFFALAFCRGWGHIPCWLAWIRVDRSGNHRPSRATVSVPSCPAASSLKAGSVYLRVARCPSTWNCPEFYYLVLFTILTGHTVA